jgi:hypothetical protein
MRAHRKTIIAEIRALTQGLPSCAPGFHSGTAMALEWTSAIAAPWSISQPTKASVAARANQATRPLFLEKAATSQ